MEVTMYSVVETFTSIQGEGMQVCMPTTFIRLFGCNLSCSFCDEPKHVKANLVKRLSKADIAAVCTTSYVVITGGEPSVNNINPLIEYLQERGHKVGVETNGYNYDNISSADVKTLAPKDELMPDKGQWTEVKILVDGTTNIAHHVAYWGKKDVAVYLQPINHETTVNEANLKLVIKAAIKYDVGISIQLHKLLGVE